MVWFRDHALAPAKANRVLGAVGSTPVQRPVRAGELLKRPGVTACALLRAVGDEAPTVGLDVLATVETDVKYEGYVRRELDRAARLRAQAGFAIPEDAPYGEFKTLSFEARQKLARIRPANLAQASRVPGVSPADLQNLVMEVKRRMGETVSRETRASSSC